MSTLKVDGIRSNSASSDAITLASDGTCIANITNRTNRNLIINGAMICSQRGSSFANITNAYCLDRYKFRNNNGVSGTFTVSQSTTSPDGFGNSLKVAVGTADSALASGEKFNIATKIEGQDLQGLAKGTSSSKKSVLSFYVKTNKTGVYTVFLYDNDNNRMFSASYTVSDSNWNRYTINVPADTTGGFDNNNESSLEIYWRLGVGSNLSSGTLASSWQTYAEANTSVGQVNFADSTSNEFYITGIQYEINESGVATDFEHRSYADELRRCQRYYYQQWTGSDVGFYLTQYVSSHRMMEVFHPVPMRATPSVSYSLGSGSASGWTSNEYMYKAYIAASYDTASSYYTEGTVTVNAEL